MWWGNGTNELRHLNSAASFSYRKPVCTFYSPLYLPLLLPLLSIILDFMLGQIRALELLESA